MTTDLAMLSWSAALCVVLFVPYVLCQIMVWGLVPALTYAEDVPEVPAWARRAKRAHMNMIENLVPFAALVLVAQAAGAANEATALGAQVFFWSRVIHPLVMIAGIPGARTLAFVGGLVGMAIIFVQILAV